ncbi:MAG: glycerophosphodiester phosphodiesterase, partial [Chlorobiales bacterium]|nr:glycerophosphodiester phosphodiesterase [Chlorobiales bacterium]
MAFDLEGHRGARGLLPENTIPAFLKALALGATTLELDLAVSRDKKLVVSHEPWFSNEIC